MKSRGRVGKYCRNPKYLGQYILDILGDMLKKAFALHCDKQKNFMSPINFIKTCGAVDLPILCEKKISY